MKNKLLAVLLVAALGMCGCAEMRDENNKTVLIVEPYSPQSSSFANESSSSFFSTEFSPSDIMQSPVSGPSVSSLHNSGSSSSSFDSESSSSSKSSSKVSNKSSSSRPLSSSSSKSSSVSPTESSSISPSFVGSSSMSPAPVGSSGMSSSSSELPSLSLSGSVSFSSSSPEVETPPVVPNSDYTALNYSEIRGVWMSYGDIEAINSSSESNFRSSLEKYFDNCVDMGINTVYFHARSFGDAFYSSSLFPRTKCVGGSYDPLKIAVEEAHERKLSIHAWINPLRACSSGDVQRENGYKIGEWIGSGTKAVLVGSYYYLNPAYDDVIKLIADGVAEIVSNYDVDGVHIDDYFYPTTDKSFDEQAFNASGYSSLSDFRFANCDKLVSSIYSAIKNVNNTMLFSVSPQGNISNDYQVLYADVKKWCSEKGYLDIIMPQIYYGFNNKSQPFEKCCSEWNDIVKQGNAKLVIGVAVYKIGTEDAWAGTQGKNEWINDENILARQFMSAKQLDSYSGLCLFSYSSLFKPGGNVKDKVEKEREALKNAFKMGN